MRNQVLTLLAEDAGRIEATPRQLKSYTFIYETRFPIGVTL